MVRALVGSRVLSQKGGGWIGEACLKRILCSHREKHRVVGCLGLNCPPDQRLNEKS